MEVLAYACVQIVPMARNITCKEFLQLITKLLNVKVNTMKVVTSLVVTVLLGKFPKDVLTTLIPSEFGILVYKDLTSRNTKYELSGIV